MEVDLVRIRYCYPYADIFLQLWVKFVWLNFPKGRCSNPQIGTRKSIVLDTKTATKKETFSNVSCSGLLTFQVHLFNF